MTFIEALLLNASFSRSANAGETKYIFAAFSAIASKEVVITESSKGIQVELQVKDTGYGIDSDASGIPDQFGASPFMPVFTVY